MNILVRMPNWVGDLVMATPVLSDLRNRFPKASITAMCRRPICDLLKEDQSIDEIFCFQRPSNNFLRRENRDVIARIKEGKFDMGILLTNSFSSAWWFWQAGIQKRIGYVGHYRRWLLTDTVSHVKEKEHAVVSYKRLLSPLGIQVSTTAPRLFITKEEQEQALALLEKFGVVGGKIIGINPGAAYGSAKCWPPERFRELAQKLVAQTDSWIVFFGDESMRDLVKSICRDLPGRVINLAGVTNLRELMCIIQMCSIFVTNDSGPSHIGAAFGVPLVALFGSTDETVTGPYGQKNQIINKKVPCSPCFKRVCPIDFPCMKEIGVEEVLARVLSHV